MDIRHFITFKKVAELGNFTRASEVLGYAQSSITAHIKALESDLGTQLFDRIGKRIELTNAGIKLLEYTNELLDIYEKIESVGSINQEPKGTIKIGVPETLMLYRLDEVFKSYKSKYPDVSIIMMDTPSARLVEALHKGELDLAFILDHEIKDPDLHVHHLIDEHMSYVYPPNSEITDLNQVPKELSIFLTEKGCSYRYLFEHALKNNGVTSENRIETWSIETIKRCVMNGIGMSYLPEIVVREEIKNNQIISRPAPNDDKKMISQIAYHKNKWQSPAMTAFLELTLEVSDKWVE